MKLSQKGTSVKESVVPGILDTNSGVLLDSITRPAANEYAALKHLITKRKLLDKQPRYYTYKILFTMSLLAVGVVYLLVVHNFWLQLCDAVYLAFVFGQIGFLGHDAGHRQIFHARAETSPCIYVAGRCIDWHEL